MGSIGLHRDAGQTDLEFFTRQWPDALGKNGYWTVLAHNSTRDGFYAAIKDARYAGTDNEHFVLAVLKTWVPAATGENFYYKEMSDSMGPGIDGASLAVLAAVPDSPSEEAMLWRKRCMDARAQERQVKRELRHGSVVKLPRSLHFNDGVDEDTFTAWKHPRTGRFGLLRSSDGRAVSVPGWRQVSGLQITAAAV